MIAVLIINYLDFLVVFFAGAFLATGFFATALGAATFLVTFLTACFFATGFLAAGFVTFLAAGLTTFLVATFFVVFFATGFLAVAFFVAFLATVFFATTVDLTSARIAACAAAKRAIGTRYGEQETYVNPTRWKNSILTGSPPCSPQTPK